ncbi:MAG: two-component regulator propeller domain-containing protein, partial [Vicinamibacterales bacterium]
MGRQLPTSRWLRTLPLWLVVCLLLVPHSAAAQELTTTTLSQLYHQALGLREGVPGSITSIAQTTDGYLWLANPSGLYRFDGVRFERFNEEAAGGMRITPSQLATTPDGALWITERGGGVHRLAGGRLNSYGDADELPRGQLLSIVTDRFGVVWVANAAGVARFAGERWHALGAEYGVPGNSEALFVDRDNAVWISAGGKVFILPPGGTRARETSIAGRIRGFAQHPDGTVWVSSTDKGTWRVNADGSAIPTASYPSQARPLLFDRRGALWRAHSQGGIDRTLLEAGAVAPSLGPPTDDWFDTLDGLTADDVFDIFQDRESNIWVATGGGLDLFRETPLVAAPFPRNAHASRMMPGPDGELWAGGGNYPLTRLHRGTVTRFPVPPPIRAIVRDEAGVVSVWSNGELWQGAGNMFNRLPRPPFDGGGEPLTAVSDRPGRVWLSFPNGGLWAFSDGRWTQAAFPGLPPDSGVLRLSAHDSRRRLWLAFRSGRLAVLDRGRMTIESELAPLGLGSPVALTPGPDRVWVALDRGLALVVVNQQPRAVQALNESAIGRIKGIVESADGSLWLNSDRGIVQVRAGEVTRLLDDRAAAVSFR